MIATCALLERGSVRCWGRWKPVANPPSLPIAAETLQFLEPAKQLDVGFAAACAVSESGEMRCWGSGKRGLLGYGDTNPVGDDEAIERIGPVPIGGKVLKVAMGETFNCALMESKAVRCWGDAPNGYPENRNIGMRETPDSAGDIPLDGARVRDVVVGIGHACALLDDGRVRCWGAELRGILGTPSASVPEHEPVTPADVVELGGKAKQLSAGGSHTCALLEDGRVRCWGLGEHGRLGYGNVNDVGDNETPASVDEVDVGGEAVSVEAGGFHTCAVLRNGCVRCWGLNDDGQLGYDNKHDRWR